MNLFIRWIPMFVVVAVLTVAGLILWVINHRKDVAAARQFLPVHSKPREGHTGT